jgi:hypothetical protein
MNWKLISDPPPILFEKYGWGTSGPVLGHYRCGTIRTVVLEKLDEDEPGRWYSDCSEHWRIHDGDLTHWMPLPEGPTKKVE